MRTIPGSRQGKSPVAAGLSELSITTTNSDHDDDAATADDDFQDAEEGEGARGSTRFGTVESYRTAREQGDDEEDWSMTTRSRDGRRRHARDLWGQASGKGTDEEVKKGPSPSLGSPHLAISQEDADPPLFSLRISSPAPSSNSNGISTPGRCRLTDRSRQTSARAAAAAAVASSRGVNRNRRMQYLSLSPFSSPLSISGTAKRE